MDLAVLRDNQMNSPKAGRRSADQGASRPSRDDVLGSAVAPSSPGTGQIMFEPGSTNGRSDCQYGHHV